MIEIDLTKVFIMKNRLLGFRAFLVWIEQLKKTYQKLQVIVAWNRPFTIGSILLIF